MSQYQSKYPLIFRTLLVSAIVAAGIASARAKECVDFKPGRSFDNIAEEYQTCLLLARRGDARAQWNVSLLTRFMSCGNGSLQQQKIADLWQDLAVRNGSPEALDYEAEGQISDLGASIRDADFPVLQSAIGKYRQAAKKGDPAALYALYRLHGMFLYSPRIASLLGTEDEAVSNLLKAADLGNGEAMNVLGQGYLWSLRKSKSTADTVSDGSDSLYASLMDRISRQSGLAPDTAAAAKRYLLRAAMLGNESAMGALIAAYADGSFGDKNIVESKAWSALLHFGSRSTQVDLMDNDEARAVCKRIKEITTLSRDVPPIRMSIFDPPGSESIVAKCTAEPETYGIVPSCLSPEELRGP